MSKQNFAIISSQESWIELSSNAHFFQSWEYGLLQEQIGRRVSRVGIYENDVLVGGAQIIFYPLSSKTVAYAPYGPFFKKSPSLEALQNFKKYLQVTSDENDTIFIKLDPEPNYEKIFGEYFIKSPSFSYRSSFIQPRGEFVMDLTTDIDSLLANMHKKTRYNIRKAGRQELITEFFYGADVLQIRDDFIQLNKETTADHNTTTHTGEYFKTYFDWLSNKSDNFVAVVKKDGKILAINIFVRNGDTVMCPFGASSSGGKKLGAYYHIKWESIVEMKKNNITKFSWGGVAVGMHDDNLSGLNQFKTGFGGEIITHSHLYDYVHNWPWYMLYLARKLQVEWQRNFFGFFRK